MIKNSIIAFCIAAGALACGGSQASSAAPPPVPATSDTVAVEAPPKAPVVWSEELPMNAKLDMMKMVVTPKMAKVFADEKDFGCATCHGPNKQSPKQFLDKLTMKDGKLTAFADHPEEAKFMAEKVVPEMAAALGLPAYDPATKKGFGCAGCHAIDSK